MPLDTDGDLAMSEGDGVPAELILHECCVVLEGQPQSFFSRVIVDWSGTGHAFLLLESLSGVRAPTTCRKVQLLCGSELTLNQFHTASPSVVDQPYSSQSRFHPSRSPSLN